MFGDLLDKSLIQVCNSNGGILYTPSSCGEKGKGILGNHMLCSAPQTTYQLIAPRPATMQVTT